MMNLLSQSIHIFIIAQFLQCDVSGKNSKDEIHPRILFDIIATELEFPVHLAHDGTPRLFVVEARGQIRLIENGQVHPVPYLDLRDKVFFGGECGLLCLAFHPNFASNGRLFVNYTERKGRKYRSVISEFYADPKSNRVDPTSEKEILTFYQPWTNHNGGQILFGPDRMLYVGTGDGGSAGDPLNSGQRLDTILGKILRIDVDQGQPYSIPPDNPFTNRNGVRPEIWSYGLRNPWRFCFDRQSGLMLAADVGENNWEEINIIHKAGNYGWNIREGYHSFKNQDRVPGLIDPIKVYGRDLGASITGGFVYRGKQIPKLMGYYVYGDYESGRVWGLKFDGGRITANIQFAQLPIRISSFGEDVEGELYLCDHYNGNILRIVDIEQRIKQPPSASHSQTKTTIPLREVH